MFIVQVTIKITLNKQVILFLLVNYPVLRIL